MPNLHAAVKTVKLWLPSTKNEPNEADRGWVKVRSKLLGGDLVDIDGIDGNAKKGLFALTRIIQEWNLTDDEAGQHVADITEDNLRELSDDDFNYLSEWVMENIIKSREGVSDDEKKTSSSTLAQPSTETPQTDPSPQPSQATSIPIS